MRRADRQVTDFNEMLEILDRCDVCRIALNGDDGYPYILPLNFGVEINGGAVSLYFHGATEGTKYRLMTSDARATFEADCSHRLVTDEARGYCTMEYESVIGRGRMEILPEAEKAHALDILMRHYHKDGFEYGKAALPSTVAFRLNVESMTAKRRIKK